jgi:hypothetical protein
MLWYGDAIDMMDGYIYAVSDHYYYPFRLVHLSIHSS